MNEASTVNATPLILNTPKLSERVVHVNNFQAKVLNADCKEMHNVIARGGGKTDIAAKYESRNMHSMPRCMRLLMGPSYRKLLTDLLPGMVVSWEKVGYIRDKHFTIGNSPIPKKLKWDDPYYAPPPSYRQFVIHWHTGAALRIGSADRKVTMNGLNVDGVTADEVKLIQEDTFNEVLKTNRANPDRAWSHLPEHNSVVTFTDKYWTRKNADWIMKKKKLADMETVKNILILQTQLNEMSLVVGGSVIYSNPSVAGKIITLLNKLRNDTVAFFEAPVYVNIPAIHPSFIMQMKRNMGENEFRASMLNHDLIRNDEKEYFYPLLNEDEHGYFADDFEKLDNLEFNFDALRKADCTFDRDLDKNAPIEISCDWGGTINCLGVFQEKRNSLNMINSMFKKHPEGIQQLAKKFCDYYRPHKDRYLKFHYDPSGNNKMPNSSETLAEEFARHLRADGWVVEMMHLGFHNNPYYELRYELCKMIMQPPAFHDPKFPYLFINRGNCKEVFVSMLDAGLRRYERKIGKDKSSEKPRSGIPPEHATHFSDVVDNIIMRKYGHLLSGTFDIPSTMGEA